MFVAEEIISKEWIVDETLEDDVEETGLAEIDKTPSSYQPLRYGILIVSIPTLAWNGNYSFQCCSLLRAGHPSAERLT